jgi:hypothetical protein
MVRPRSTPGLIAATLAALGILLAACSGDAGTKTSAGDGAATSTTSQSPPTTPGSNPSGWTPILEESEGPIPAGRVGMTANGRPDAPWAVIDVPHGFVNFGRFALLNEHHDVGFHGLGYWTISGVDRHPCDETLDLIDVGSTVAGLAAAFDEQRMTRTTEASPVTIGGHDGLYLELHVPDDLDFADCALEDYHVWVSDPGGGRHMQEPGQVDRLWILDVEGEVVVLQATAVPGVSDADRDRLSDMVESAEFVARE